jgi:adsorption protein B
MWFNFGFFVLRYWLRVESCRRVYGIWNFIGVAVRWPVALFINMVAVWRAWKIYVGESDFARRPIAWSKTAHEVPEDFAQRK